MYVEEEYFENDNLYRCGACDKLVEASKVMHQVTQYLIC